MEAVAISTHIFIMIFKGGIMSKYVCIVKTSQSHLKYHVNDLLKFTAFLDDKHRDWKFYNVYDKKTREQIASFTINNRPVKRHIHL